MARPRTISEDRIMTALGRTVAEVGPARLTLADVAARAGVSTGLLVRRYGSKRSLLLAFTRAAATGFIAAMREAYRSADDPVEGLIAAVVGGTDGGGTPEEFANHLAFLHLELADAEFRAALAAFDQAVLDEIRDYLDQAAGQLPAADRSRLADAVNALRNGSQLAWATHRRGSLAAAMRRDLTTLLTPYLTRGSER